MINNAYLLCRSAPDGSAWHLKLARWTREGSFHLVVTIHADKVAFRALVNVAQWQAQTHCALVYFLHLVLHGLRHLKGFGLIGIGLAFQCA